MEIGKLQTDNKIIVVDSIMGSGKTTWSIQHIDNCPFENILYITPFLDEVDRILTSTKREFKQPLNKGSGKLDALNDMLGCQDDIVSTHQLFKHLDEDSKTYIESGNYTLILDEVLNVIEPYNVKKNDIQILKESNCVTIDDDGFVIWNKEKFDYESTYDEIKRLAESKSLIYVNNVLLLWIYPPEIFKLFKKIYVLTYLFEASILKNYFELYKINYEKMSICKVDNTYNLCPYFVPDTSVFTKKINILEGKINDNIIQKDSGLSATWFSASHNDKHIKQLQRNIYNYFTNILKAKANTILWTTFKKQQPRLKGKGYTKQFLSCNCRSTNQYADTYNLAYCINVYLHPFISQFFKQHNIKVNDELYALSEMLQWIWRSRIRNNKNINVYIPSNRMRNLLLDWLNYSNVDTDKIAS